MVSIFLPGWLTGALTFVVMSLALLLHFCVLLPLAVLKFLLPLPAWRRLMTQLIVGVATSWVGANAVIYRLMFPLAWQIELNGRLDPDKTYLLICNHQSWIDIQLLFDVFHRRTPFLRFFLKRDLIYVPIIGLTCWSMDFPFMKRHSREAIRANPALRNEDLETTRLACERYRQYPVTLVNFLEGTRFTEAKRSASGSPFRHLLRPKSAGLAFAMRAMGDQFAGIIDVTVSYQPTDKSPVWSFLSGEQTELALHAEVLPVPQELIRGDYDADPEFRARFQAWVNALWSRKDARLERMQQSARPAPRPHLT